MRARTPVTALATFAVSFLASFVAVAAAPPSAPPPERPLLLVLELKLENSNLDGQEAASLSGVVAVLAAEDPTFEVVAGEDLRRLLDLEAERQLMNCSDDSCLAEISDALGADYVIFGSLGRLGANTSVQLQVYDHANARPVGRELVTMRSLDNAADDLRPSVRTLVDGARRDYAARHGGAPGSASDAAVDSAVPITLVAGGVGVIVVGAVATTVALGSPWFFISVLRDMSASAAIQDAATPFDPDLGPLGSTLGLTQTGVTIVSFAASALALGAASYGVYALYLEGEE